MILVDTSVWINFLRYGDRKLAGLLEDNRVCTHNFIIGELYLGNIKKRKEFLELITDLPRVEQIDFEELIFFIEKNNLFGKGIGLVDIAISASAILENIKIWTIDKKLNNILSELKIKW